jgi:hypothetical protein
MEVTRAGLARFFEVVLPHMNKVQRRVVAGEVLPHSARHRPGYSLQAYAKVNGDRQHRDRDAHIRYINGHVVGFVDAASRWHQEEGTVGQVC